MLKSRKYLKRKSYAKKRYSSARVNRYKSMRYNRTKDGYLKVVRKTGEIFIQNSAIAGVLQINDTTGSCLVLNTTSPVSTGFANTYDIPFAMKFCLSQIINSTDITNLCDRYMLKKTVVRIYFNSNMNAVQSAYTLPQITYHTDDDDAVIPTPTNVREKMGAKIKYFGVKNMVQITLYPRTAPEIFNTGTSTAYAVGKRQFINSTYPNVEHYGLKGVLQNVNLTTAPFQVGFKFDVEHTIIGRDIQ